MKEYIVINTQNRGGFELFLRFSFFVFVLMLLRNGKTKVRVSSKTMGTVTKKTGGLFLALLLVHRWRLSGGTLGS